MNVLKQRICKFPGCEKETFNKKSYFCGEHERKFQEGKRILLKTAPIIVTGLFTLANRNNKD